jgi:hypothetical protein
MRSFSFAVSKGAYADPSQAASGTLFFALCSTLAYMNTKVFKLTFGFFGHSPLLSHIQAAYASSASQELRLLLAPQAVQNKRQKQVQ